MTDETISLLEATRLKLSAKAERLDAQLKAIRIELEEIETTIRVLSRIAEGKTSSAQNGERGGTQAQVLEIVPSEMRYAISPKEVHQRLTSDGSDISADNVRTVLSRLKLAGCVQGIEGRYWKVTSSAPETEDNERRSPHDEEADPFADDPLA